MTQDEIAADRATIAAWARSNLAPHDFIYVAHRRWPSALDRVEELEQDAEAWDHITADNARLRAALIAIADDPHQSYDQGAALTTAQRQYNIGVADGHRCAARTALVALGRPVES